MGLIKLTMLPFVCSAILLYLWYSGRITGLITVICIGAFAAAYSFIQSCRYGLFTGVHLNKFDFPKIKLYYKEYQCNYKDLKERVMKELKDEDHNMLKSKATVNYVAIYYDSPASLSDEDRGRACAGFALRGEAEDDIGINKVLEMAKFQIKELDCCEAAAMKVPKIDDLSYSVSIIKTMNKLWECANACHKGAECLFQLEEKKEVSSGVFTGDKRDQYMFHSLLATATIERNSESSTPIRSKKEK